MDQAPDLNDAIGRLKAFHLIWNSGYIIDEQKRLTAGDIDTLISFIDDLAWVTDQIRKRVYPNKSALPPKIARSVATSTGTDNPIEVLIGV